MSSSDSSGKEITLPGGNNKKGSKLGYGIDLSLSYDPDDEYKKPGYIHFPSVEARTYNNDACKVIVASASLGGARYVKPDGPVRHSAEFMGPHCYLEGQSNQQSFSIGSALTSGQASAHVGNLGMEVQG